MPAQIQYEHNFGMRPQGDITEIKSEEIPEHDLLFSGFPCQPFSIIGDRQGLEDPRGGLVYEVVRVLRAKRPKGFLLENVRQFSSMHGGSVLRAVIGALEDSGYSTKWRVLNALDFGLPQKRERTIIVGLSDRQALDKFRWPDPSTRRSSLSEILEPNPNPRHFASERIRARRQQSHKPRVTPSIWHENKGGNISSHLFSCALRAGASHNYLLVNGERRLTPREQLRLQGFPEKFEVIGKDSQIRKQTGNAVPVPMVQAVMKEVLVAQARTIS